jgi:hypothetical protein
LYSYFESGRAKNGAGTVGLVFLLRASETSEKPDSDEVFPHEQGTQSNQPG